MPDTDPAGTLADVRGFLDGLRAELPEVFGPARPPAPAAPPAGLPPGSGDPGERAVFAAKCAEWAPRLGVDYGRVSVREQRSLWGSCSRKGDLSFNRRLLEAPPEVLEYVVIHELAHRLRMDHGRRFWQAVARHCPEFKARRRWLREHDLRLRPGLDGAP